MRLWPRLFDFLAPRTCAACRRDLPLLVAGPLCGDCLALARPQTGAQCRRCGVADDSPARLCRRCRSRLFAVDCIRAAFAYRPPVRELLHAFKYRGRLDAGRLLAGWMAGLLPRHPELGRPLAVVCVPLHPGRLRERGFNQAEWLGRAVAAAARLPLQEGLRRVKKTRAQWGLSRRERGANLEGAFAWAGTRPARRVLLVDDVCTSGSTLEACARALQAAGAEDIRAFVLARD